MITDFSFSFCTDGLDLFYNSNFFGHATLKGDFIVLDLDNTYDNTSTAFVSSFDSHPESVKWHARLHQWAKIKWEGWLKKVF